MVRIVQWNMGRGKEAGMAFSELMRKERPDIVLLQEPYAKYVTPQGYRRFGERGDKVMTLVRADWGDIMMRVYISNGNVVVI